MTTNHVIHHEGRTTDTPKIWRDMTPEEKGALLLADHEGKVIEQTRVDIPDDWKKKSGGFLPEYAYRVRPAPKITEHVLWWGAYYDAVVFSDPRRRPDTHKITIRYPGKALPFGTYTGPDGAEFVVEDARTATGGQDDE